MHPNPFMDEVGIKVVGQGDIGNRGVSLRTLGDDLSLKGLGIGTAFLWHWCPLKKVKHGVHLNLGGHHRLKRWHQEGVLPGRLRTAKLFDSIRDTYGDETLSQMCNAYAAGKHDQWIRFTSHNGQMDMPLARHMIIALHLFGSADAFESALKKESILKSVAGARLRGLQGKPIVGKEAQFRQKVETLLAVRADVGLEYLWLNAYKATRWLYENDKSWLMAKLSGRPLRINGLTADRLVAGCVKL
ncbi:hypothetical protein [Pseudomonas fontis]|uniref:Uncharacterized protein n=1 Tax=Pseudomonas fontis TaxID=2942633 RepID=A0ABT5NY40_9PSED|nr:hypothetical protein [Pseudomonas fontis]MDD0976442.1 hypothetical protein [Pseudomonas fontis]MDD0993121.1 hypothetical protein [Pseudomonas fontis]